LSVEQKRELVKSLLSLQAGESTATLPLSFGQQSLWFVYQLAPESPAYNFLLAARIPAALDVPAFVHACQALAERHPALAGPLRVTDPYAVVDLLRR